jgi:hypothetical protein
MSVQFKFKDSVDEKRRDEVVAALGRAGFAARSLFPNQKRPQLASIFTLPKVGSEDLTALRRALTDYDGDIEYVEASPKRAVKKRA